MFNSSIHFKSSSIVKTSCSPSLVTATGAAGTAAGPPSPAAAVSPAAAAPVTVVVAVTVTVAVTPAATTAVEQQQYIMQQRNDIENYFLYTFLP
jgi:hypothetical protein